MDESAVIEIGTQAIKIIASLAGPMLIAAMLVGIAVSVMQAITQINEATLTFIPKMIAVIVVLAVMAPWMLETIQEYTIMIFTNMELWKK
ncbi:MAG: flagellar biosynthetic protein FliQ [Bdellovibrionaceae bacterium]|nr:flagellar biosynthetic protein FliQ [Pseudobdellovibrionaceae bacterium]|tara:strand:- start:665 stop:934 length:270 start_codon:yes stop_codon:yes gene_type:complete